MGSPAFLSPTLLALTYFTVIHGQYYDIYPGLQRILQPYQRPVELFAPYNDNRFPGINRQTNSPEIKRRNENIDRHTRKPPQNVYSNNYSTTTPKSSRKTTKPQSSQSNKQTNFRNFNSDTIFSDYNNPSLEVTTKRKSINSYQRTDRTTMAPFNNFYDSNRSTLNPFESDIQNNRGAINNPVTDNVFANENPRDVYNTNNFETRVNPQSNSQNSRTIYTEYNTNYDRVPTNSWSNQNNKFDNDEFHNRNGENVQQPTNQRNPDVNAVNPINRSTQIHRNNNFGSTNTGFVNNRGTPNNFGNNGVSNTDNDGETNYDYNNPLLNRPGVKPVPVDVNQPPITNKPVTINPYDGGFGDSKDSSEDSPDILIGPDPGDMSESQKRKYLNMAEKMCDRYKSMHLKEIVALPLLPAPDPVQVNVSSCVPITAPLILGGRVATINEFPHMALVGWKKLRNSGYSWKCGGSLISNQHVLTAGHCTYHDKDSEVVSALPQAVQLGSSNLDDPGALVVRISAIIRHPKYKQRRSYYDIAVIQLVQTVKFTEVIRPACLGVPPAVGKKVIATGWGRTEFGGDHSEELRSVSLPVWNMAECREIWGTSLKLPNGPSPDSHMCAGERAGGKDTCQGDSGGPAQIQDGCVWRVVAVTSYGRSCGAPNTPALYAITQRVFVAAVIFGYDENQRVSERPAFEDRVGAPFNNRQTNTRSREPTYTINSFRRQ